MLDTIKSTDHRRYRIYSVSEMLPKTATRYDIIGKSLLDILFYIIRTNKIKIDKIELFNCVTTIHIGNRRVHIHVWSINFDY